MSTIVNLTPHEIVLRGITLTSAGVARCETSALKVDEVNGIAINRRSLHKL